MEQIELTDLATLSYLSVMINNLEKDTDFSKRLFKAEINEDEEDKKQVQKDVANHDSFKILLHSLVLTSTKIRDKYFEKDITDKEIKKFLLEEFKKQSPTDEEGKKKLAELEKRYG